MKGSITTRRAPGHHAPSRRLAVALAVAATLLFAGCGSRANFALSQGASGQGGDQSLGQGGGPSLATSGTSGGNAAGARSGSNPAVSLGGGPSSGSGQGGGTGTSAVGQTPEAGSSGPEPGGSTGGGSHSLAPIRVGFIQQDASGASALLGSNIPITSVARQRQMAQWLVNYVNDHGGINGRKIIPTFETVSATSQDPQRVAACEAMAQDQHDEAVMDMNEMLTDDTYGCFARNHVDFFGNAADTDEEYLRAHAPYVTTTDMALNRQMTALVDGANRVHFLSGQKVGIILPDIPEAHRDYAPYLGAPLARLGIHPLVRYITETTGGAQTAQTDNAELAFATAGVTRVLFIHDIIVYLAFTSQASAEHYHPHYAYPDFAGAAGVAAYYGSTSTNTGSIAVSAVPSSVPPTDKYDEKSAGQTKIHRSQLTPGARKCLDIMSKESGVNWYDPKQSQDPDLDAIYYCDEFFLFVKAASAVPGGYTPATLGQGLQRVGSSYLSSHVESTDYSSGREDGAASYAVGLYNAKCSCFVRSTPWIPGP